MSGRLRVVLPVIAVAVLALHAGALPRSPEDIDSLNFALGVESYDVAAHRPHPPGYPVFIAAAKASTGLTPIDDRDRRAAIGLAIWSVAAGVIAVFVVAAFWRAAGVAPRVAAAAALVSVTAPLMWFTMVRPMSDVAGLVIALAAQAAVLRGWRQTGERAASAGLLVAGAALAGLAAGVRSQAVWINAPLLIWVIVDLARAGRRRAAAHVVLYGAAGVLLWAVPLIWDAGGIGAYLDALRRQGEQDFSGVTMLLTSPEPEVIQETLARTFTEPWLGRTFARLMLLSAIAGLAHLALRARGSLGIVLATFAPYLCFHVLLQEAVTLRYSLPVAIAVAGLAVVGWSWIGTRIAWMLAAAAAIAGVVITQPRLDAYASEGWPLQRAFRDMQARAAAMPSPPLLRTQHQVWHGVQRWFDWYRPVWDAGPQPFPGDREWLDVVAHFRTGSARPVWLLADVTRNDVALFDPRSTQLAGEYRLRESLRQVIGADTRLDSAAWWIVDPPRWMLGRGWSLTPEIAGMTRVDKLGPQVAPADAYLRRGPGPIRILIGGRLLETTSGPARIHLEIDGHGVAEIRVMPDAPWFTHWIDLPAGVPDGPDAYATLTVRVTGEQSAAPWVGLEQFDAAPADQPILAFTDGWHEMEHDPRTGRTWRWMAARGTLIARGGDADVRLRLHGESPRRYFDRAPAVVVRAGAREIARFQPDADFEETVTIPRAALRDSQDTITIETDRTFVPAERAASPDRRQLGLAWFAVEIAK